MLGKSGRMSADGSTSAPEVDGNRMRFTLAVRFLAARGARPLSIPGEKVATRSDLRSAREQALARKWKRGTNCQPPPSWNSLSARNPGGFDYRPLSLPAGDPLDGPDRRPVPGRRYSGASLDLRADIDDCARWLGERVEALYPEEIAGLIRGMILGEREAVPPDAEEDFALLGGWPIFWPSPACTSGYLWVRLRAVEGNRPDPGKSGGAVILLLPLIGLLTGAGAPVVRAAIMAGLALLAVILRRCKDGLTPFWRWRPGRCLIWNPYQLFQPGFQLSFAVTLALLVAAGPVSRIMPFPWRWLNQLVAVTLVAQLASFPLLIFHFYEFSVLSWVANLVAVPVVSLWVIPLSMAALALGAVHEGLA